ncbi:MAG TPA: hypothetical protein VNX01_11935, partial [Bacteroidia bacterium]|nr:hypothetical protein [Bacteroidia bacterium]
MKLKYIISYLILVANLLHVCAQTDKNKLPAVNFDPLIQRFKKYNYSGDTIKLPLIHKNKDYKIELSPNPICFDLKEIVLKNSATKKYPIAYSVIYQGKLITLFEPGHFICYTIATMQRDVEFENKINLKTFQYNWRLDDKLVAISNGKYFYLNSDNVWLDYAAPPPLINQPTLFEDSTYISFCDCYGEFGGTVYFYNKKSLQVHFAKATCANSVIKKESKYFVLSELGHGSDHSNLQEIEFPDKLAYVDTSKLNKRFRFRGEAPPDYIDSSKASKTLFRYWEIAILSAFPYKGKILNLVSWRDQKFLAELENNKFKIVTPLFNKEFFIHDPITNI